MKYSILKLFSSTGQWNHASPISFIKTPAYVRYGVFLCILCLILFKCILFLSFTYDPYYISFHLGQAFLHSFPRIQYYMGFVGLLASFSFLFKKRSHFWFLFALNLVLSLLFMIDLWYLRGFGTMPSVGLLQQTGNLDHLSGAILPLIHIQDFLFLIDLVPLALLGSLRTDILSSFDVRRRYFLPIVAVATLMAFYVPITGIIFHTSDKRAIFSTRDASITSYNLSPIGFHVLDIYSYFEENRKLTLTPQQQAEIHRWFHDNRETVQDNSYKGMFAGKNLVIIQLESFERFVIDQSINGQDVTPNLNKLIHNSFYFSQVHEQVKEGTTSDAEFMTNTSIYPLNKGSAFIRFPYDQYEYSLPKLFEEKGYQTLAIHPEAGTYWNWMKSDQSIGFKTCYDSSTFVHDETIGMGLSDGSLFRQVPEKLAAVKQPFYAFLLTLSGHSPFDLPKQFRTLHLPNSLDQTTMGGYLQSAHYTDAQIGNFLKIMNDKHLLNNTVFVIYGDHEGIHKYFGKAVQTMSLKENWWLNNHKLTPLIIFNPSIKGKQFENIGGEVDIFPTIAYLMGLNYNHYEYSTMGKNLFNTARNFDISSYGTYDGDPTKHDLDGRDIADLVIRSDYFAPEAKR